jgi:hypothetical protein
LRVFFQCDPGNADKFAHPFVQLIQRLVALFDCVLYSI